MVKEAVEEKTELSKEQIQLEKKKKNNIRIYPIYRVFSLKILLLVESLLNPAIDNVDIWANEILFLQK